MLKKNKKNKKQRGKAGKKWKNTKKNKIVDYTVIHSDLGVGWIMISQNPLEYCIIRLWAKLMDY
jgi:hypothetical protein